MEITAAAAQATTYTTGKTLAEQINDYLAASKTSIATLASEIPAIPARRSPAISPASTRGHLHHREAPRGLAGPAHRRGRGAPGAGAQDRTEARLL